MGTITNSQHLIYSFLTPIGYHDHAFEVPGASLLCTGSPHTSIASCDAPFKTPDLVPGFFYMIVYFAALMHRGNMTLKKYWF